MDNFKLWSPFKVLPTAYDESLSYYEAICKISEKVNEALEYIYNFGSDVISEANAYTDEQILQLKNALEKQINDFGTKYDGQFKDIENKLTELNLSISELYVAWAKYQGVVDEKFKVMYNELILYIDEKIGSVGQLYVISPVTGRLEPIQKVLNDIYKALNVGALTAVEYDRMNLTAQEYDNLQLTAQEYDNMRFIPKVFKAIYLRMRSPFSGNLDYYDNIINGLANLHKDALTATEYDDKNLTATAYDALNVTAYRYDWEGKTAIA